MEKNENNKEIWLITLPHAGGSSALFKSWKKKINCNILNIEYPGRWSRINEELLESFDELRSDVMKKICMSIPAGSDIIIFGHSLGAIIGWDIAEEMESYGFNIVLLLLSGSQNPSTFPEKNIAGIKNDNEIMKLAGYDPIEYEESVYDQYSNLILPVMKSDLKVCNSFKLNRSYCDIPSVILYGLQDVFTEINEVIKWDRYAKVKGVLGLNGNHLFIKDSNNVDVITHLINYAVGRIYNDNESL